MTDNEYLDTMSCPNQEPHGAHRWSRLLKNTNFWCEGIREPSVLSVTNRIFLDTEFYEDGRTIQLISIGLVKESGETYYAETADAWHLAQSTRWLFENVLGGLSRKDEAVKGRRQIAEDIVKFAGDSPEFWAWYGSYDWVVLCQLYGRMIDLPKGWPMYIHDFKQLCDETGMTTVPLDAEDEHNALNDAGWLRDQFLRLRPFSGTSQDSLRSFSANTQ